MASSFSDSAETIIRPLGLSMMPTFSGVRHAAEYIAEAKADALRSPYGATAGHE